MSLFPALSKFRLLLASAGDRDAGDHCCISRKSVCWLTQVACGGSATMALPQQMQAWEVDFELITSNIYVTREVGFPG